MTRYQESAGEEYADDILAYLPTIGIDKRGYMLAWCSSLRNIHEYFDVKHDLFINPIGLVDLQKTLYRKIKRMK